jgi:rod shape-determining protein MreC
MRPDNSPGLRRYWPLLIFLLLGTLAGAWHNRALDHGHPDPISATVRTVATPPANVLSGITRWVGARTGWLLHGYALDVENRRLRERVAQLEGANAALQEAANAGRRLQADLGFVQRQTRPPLPAEVIARKPDANFDTILISRGSLDGVHNHSVVVTHNGVVGQVGPDVGPNSAIVILLTDQNGRVGARVERPQSRVMGICEGDYQPLIPLIDLPNDADIKIGDQIVTSGDSIFPKGLPIGQVKSIKMDDGNITKTARLKPAVDFDRLEEVYVLR